MDRRLNNEYRRKRLWLLPVACLLALMISGAASGQFMLRGLVKDSTDMTPLPGVNVYIQLQGKGVVTDAQGKFEIESATSDAALTFAFIGLKTIELSISDEEMAEIIMAPDHVVLESPTDYYVKTGLELGYYGDNTHAPLGLIAVNTLQSIGSLRIGINSSFKYWKGGENNSGLEISANRRLPGNANALPDYIFLGYRSINYGEHGYGLRQWRGIVETKLGHFFSLDLGVARSQTNELVEGSPSQKNFTSGIVGLTKVFYGVRFIGGLGLYANVSYNPAQTMFEAGAFKGIGLGPRLPSMTLMVKYYDYGVVQGLMMSLRFSIFNTENYCCMSFSAYAPYLTALK